MSIKTVRTIADIARLAGVSKSTVSRALNDSPLIGEETKAKIRALAHQHNFQINAPARQLSMQRTAILR
jgi:DNA-binding LacI/PurR family transcriptional regulator